MLVIFDNDGVLVNSEALVKEAQAEALASAGFPTFTKQRLIAETVGLKWDAITAMAEAETGRSVPTETHTHSRSLYKQKAHAGLTAIAGIEDVLRGLQAAGIPYCVASTGAPEKIRFSLTTAGLIDFFEDSHLFSVTMVKRGKPAPDVYLHAAAQMGHDPANCVVIEDATAGIIGAHRAHMRVIGFTGGDHAQTPAYKAMLAAQNPNHLITHMADLFPLLQRQSSAA